ncbi:MAG: sulfotransferase [Myxococcota bacterium]|jgi:hypothetical protein|nr:sulfotransferase [Myxococcota bacterium]
MTKPIPFPIRPVELAESFRRQGRPLDALRALEHILGEDSADAWLVAAEVAADAGNPEAALRFVHQSRRSGEVSDERRERKDLLERIVRLGLHPAPGPGVDGALGALLRRRPLPSPWEVGPGTDADPEVVGRLVRWYLHLGQAEMLEGLQEPRAAQLLPGLPTLVASALVKEARMPLDHRSPQPILVGGSRCSGVGLMLRMLEAHVRIVTRPELGILSDFCTFRQQCEVRHGPDLRRMNVEDRVVDRSVHAAMRELVEALTPPGIRLATRLDLTEGVGPVLARLLPRSRFILVVRDGRSVVDACLEPSPAESGQDLGRTVDPVQLAGQWMEDVARGQAWKQQLGRRCLEVRYERLVQQPRKEMARIMAFIGETWDEAGMCVAARKPHTGDLDRWRGTLTGDRVAQVIGIAGPLLSRLGYR